MSNCRWVVSVASYLRESAEANIGVRVGVHSGRVESAIVGLARWRYDVWSSSVQLVEHVVHTSFSGSVQPTLSVVTATALGRCCWLSRGCYRFLGHHKWRPSTSISPIDISVGLHRYTCNINVTNYCACCEKKIKNGFYGLERSLYFSVPPF